MIGITIPGGSVSDTIEAMVQAEARGVPSVWLTTAGAGLDALTIFAAAAMRTERVVFGASIVPTWPRHPIVVAQQAQVIDQIAPGRLVVGLGTSNRPAMEALLGLNWRASSKHLREYAIILKSLLQTGSVDFKDDYYTAKAEISEPLSIPVMIGALRQRTYELCGEVADGAISWLAPWSHILSTSLPSMKASAKKAARNTPAMVVHVPVCLSDDINVVRQATKSQLGFYPELPTYAAMFNDVGFRDLNGQWTDELIDAVVAHGSDEVVARRLEEIRAQGADRVIASPLIVDGSSFDRVAEVVSQANLMSKAMTDVTRIIPLNQEDARAGAR